MSKERDEKLKALQLTVDRLEKTYGKGSVMRLGDKPIVDEIDKISTGSISLDIALGVGGFPKGRVIEIYGPESSGKTTLAKNLAHRYDTCYVEEAGRKFYEEINAEIVLLEDFPQIAYEHKYHERQARKTANKVYFVDTEAITTQFFSMAYLGIRRSILDEIAKLQDYDLWLFLEADIEWVADGLRSFGNTQVRYKNNQLLKSLLNEFGVHYHIISGNYEDRYDKATDYIDKLLTK